MSIRVCDWQAVEAAMLERSRNVPYGVKDDHPSNLVCSIPS